MKRPCVHCGKECEPWQRNTDGTYLHDACAAALAASANVDRPTQEDSER